MNRGGAMPRPGTKWPPDRIQYLRNRTRVPRAKRNAMPIHDWSRVEAGIFHHFHHLWISEISDALNSGVWPDDYYALAEQFAAGRPPTSPLTKTGLLVAPPKVRFTAETDWEFYRRKQTTVAVMHVSGDRVVAMIEVVSPGNKAVRSALRSFVEKAAELLGKRVHLLILDLHPPGKHDPHGIHAAIWEEVSGQEFEAPADKPLTLAAYESGLRLRAFVEPVAVGDTLPDMPLYLEPDAYVNVPLERTYQTAFAAVPRRWRRVLEGPAAQSAP